MSPPSVPSASAPTAVLLAAGGAIVLWGMTFTGMRICLRSFDPAAFACGRYLVASVILLLLAIPLRPAWPRWREMPLLLALACTGVSVYNLLLCAGIRHMAAGPGSFINNASSLFAALFAVLLLGERPSAAIWAGLGLSLAGVAVLAHAAAGGSGLSPAAFLLVGSAMCYGLYSVLQKPLLVAHGAFWVVAWSIWLGTAMLLPEAPALWREAVEAPRQALIVLALIGLLPTVGGFLLWSWCLRQVPVARLAPALYAVPVVAVATAWLVLGERLQGETALGCLVIIAGVGLGSRGRVLARAAPMVTTPPGSSAR